MTQPHAYSNLPLGVFWFAETHGCEPRDRQDPQVTETITITLRAQPSNKQVNPT